MQNVKLDGNLTHFAPGTLLVKENDNTRKMFIIKRGKVRVFKSYIGQRVTLAILGEGEVFGELSFFDAEPRSASVETLTEVSAIVIEGEQAAKEIAGLPPWIFPLLRSVFHRFRAADQKIIVLQSMNEFQKRNFKMDNVAQTIYFELLRFIKTLKLVYLRLEESSENVSSTDLYNELDQVLGTRTIGLRVFLQLLMEHHIITQNVANNSDLVKLNLSSLEALSDYLVSEVKLESFLLLSHTSVALLGRIVGYTYSEQQIALKKKENGSVVIKFREIKLNSLPLYQESLKELHGKKVLKVLNDTLELIPDLISRHYTYQSILKAFDHTIINLE